MAVTENNVLLRRKDTSGNSNLLYPITMVENVDGLEESLATKVDTVTVTGSGNAVTEVSKSGTTLTLSKGSTFLTDHPTISTSSDTTSTESPAHGKTFTAVDSVTRDSNGHVTKVNVKTVTIPSSEASSSTAGLMSAADKTKLDGITASADSVSFSASATRGNEVGTITINGSSTTMFSPTQTSVSGNAGTATKLAKSRTIQTNLGSTNPASFDGSANITPGVTGTLPLTNGGTGGTTADEARTNLGATKIYRSSTEPTNWTTNDIWFQLV